jgi:nucleoside-diphosphate-sugar epimerase
LTTVLITGATGFIGSHLVDELLKRNYNIKCLVRKTSNLRWLEGKPVEYIYGGLFDNKAISGALKDVDYVYHIAGVTFAKKKEEYFRGNSEATKNFIEVCYKTNPNLKRFLFVSSQTTVGPSPDKEHPVDENTLYHPITTYGRSKMEAEKAVLEYFDKMKCTVVRAPAVYGPRDAAILEYFRAMNMGLQALIGFKEKLVSLIHGIDLVLGIILSAEAEISASQIYFISSEKFYSWKEVGEFTTRLMGKKNIRIKIPHFAVYTVGAFAQFFSMFSSKAAILNLEKCKDITQQYWTCSIEKAKRDLGFREKIGIEEGIKQTIDWYRKAGWIK